MSRLLLNPYSNAQIQLSYVGAFADSDGSCSISGFTSGDLAIACHGAVRGGGLAAGVVPTGFTEIKNVANGGGDTALSVGYKLLTNETSVSFSTSNNEDGCVVMIFHPDRAITSVSLSTWNGEGTAGDPSSQSVSEPTSLPAIVIGVMVAVAAGATTFGTASPSFDTTAAVDTGNGVTRMGYKLYNSSPAGHTIDISDLGSGNALASGWISVS